MKDTITEQESVDIIQSISRYNKDFNISHHLPLRSIKTSYRPSVIVPKYIIEPARLYIDLIVEDLEYPAYLKTYSVIRRIT